MELKVPYVRQPPGSFTCGPASAAMVLKYFGHTISYKRVAEELFVAGKGISPSRLGSYFLTKGLTVTVQAWPSGIAEGLRSSECIEGEAGVALLKCAAQTGTTNNARKLPKEITPLIRRGASLVLKPITLGDLRIALEGGALIIPLVDLKCLWGIPRKTGHYNVIRGITDRDSKAAQPYVFISDPELGPRLIIPVQRVLEACNSLVGLMLFVKPRVI